MDFLFHNACSASREVKKCVVTNTGMFPRIVQMQMRSYENLSLGNTKFANSYIVHRLLNSTEKGLDSNERELLAVVNLIRHCAPIIKNSVITVHVDNENAAIISNKGSPKPRLQCHAEQIRDICDLHNIS